MNHAVTESFHGMGGVLSSCAPEMRRSMSAPKLNLESFSFAQSDCSTSGGASPKNREHTRVYVEDSRRACYDRGVHRLFSGVSQFGELKTAPSKN